MGSRPEISSGNFPKRNLTFFPSLSCNSLIFFNFLYLPLNFEDNSGLDGRCKRRLSNDHKARESDRGSEVIEPSRGGLAVLGCTGHGIVYSHYRKAYSTTSSPAETVWAVPVRANDGQDGPTDLH